MHACMYIRMYVYLYRYVFMYHLDQRPDPIYHIYNYVYQLYSLNNLVIGSGGSTFSYVHLHAVRMYIFEVHFHFLIIACFIPSQALILKFTIFWTTGKCDFRVCKSSLSCFNNAYMLLSSIVQRTQLPFLVNALVDNFILLYIISKLY